MITFIMLTTIASESIETPETFEALEKQVKDRIASECPNLEWVHNYAVLGPYDYIDIFRAPDTDTAFKVATIVRSFGHAHTEVWTATEWKRFKDMIRHLPAGA
jgi:uncharacterized protein with GYD domain